MGAGTTAIANLLRLARAECRATVAFVVVAANGGSPEMLRVPSEGGIGTPSDEMLAQLAERAALDPEFGQARTFVRTVQLPAASLLAVAPVPGAGRTGMVGVLGQDPTGFAPAQLELLDRLAERIARHLKALHEIGSSGTPSHAPPGAAPVDQGAGSAAPAEPDRPPGDEPGPTSGQPGPTSGQPGPAPSSSDRPAADVGRPPPAPGVQGAATSAPPPLSFTGFGAEPGGVIAPSAPAPFEPGGRQRHPLGPQNPSAAGGYLAPSAPGAGHDAPPALSSPGVALRRDTSVALPASEPPSPEPPSPGSWWAASDPVTGLPSLGQFFSRAGRLLGSDVRASGAVALVLVEVPGEQTAPAAARALAAQLRFSDPLARVDRDLFAAAVLLFPGSMRGDAVEERLGTAVRSALDWLAPVRTTHVLAEPGDRRDVDELLRQAIAGLPGRVAAGSRR